MKNVAKVEKKSDDGSDDAGFSKKSVVASRRGAGHAASGTEVTATIGVPPDGGWGWVVVLAAFLCIFVLDGAAFTFGSVLRDMTDELQITESAVALVNSLAVAVYFLGAPLGSAVINRFGFRSCVMVGSVICAASLTCTYYSTSYAAIVLFYGACTGCGYCLVNLSSILVVGFYFERLRSLALALTATGSSVGIMVMFPVNSYIVELAGWRSLALLQSGMFGLVYFLGTAYRPLLQLTVSKTLEQEQDVTMYMPSHADMSADRSATRSPDMLGLTPSEKIFNSISSNAYPTVSQMMKTSIDSLVEDPEKGKSQQEQAGASSAKAVLKPMKPSKTQSIRSRMTVTAANPHGVVSRAQVKRVHSNLSRMSDRTQVLDNITQDAKRTGEEKSGEVTRKLYQIKSADATELVQEEDKSVKSENKLLEIRTPEDSLEQESKMISIEFRGAAPEEQPQKRGCWYWLCHWEKHVAQSRPMYRDDAFYEGRVKHLPQYKASQMEQGSARTGLEYQLEVTRATAAADLADRRSLFSTAVRRVLATMMDPKLLARRSFICLCVWAFLTYLGYLVPFIFLKERNIQSGIDTQHCALFVSAIGLSNAIGRLVLGTLAWKLDTSAMLTGSVIVAGLGTMLSGVSYNVYYQYGYCCLYGFCVASIACLRSLVLVELYGLEKLTNATGMLLLFQGVGSLIGTPLASTLKASFGFGPTFLVAGGFVTAGGVCLIPVKRLAKMEKIRDEASNG